MKKDVTTENVRKAREMAGRRLNIDVLEELECDSSRDDSSDEEGDDRPKGLIHATGGQEDVPVLKDVFKTTGFKNVFICSCM